MTDQPGTESGINPAFSPDGRRIAFMAGPTIRIVDLAGGPSTTVTDSIVGVPGLAWGATATSIALVLRTPEGAHVWVVRSGSQARTRVTFDRSFTSSEWSPDGRTLLALATPGELFVMPADGGALPRLVPADTRNMFDASWTPDGIGILYAARSEPMSGIYRFRPGTDSTPEAVVTGEGVELEPTVSPNSRWLLYQVTRPGNRSDVFVRPYPSTAASLHQVSTDGGTEPQWSGDGREIFYRNRNDDLVAVSVEAGPGFSTGAERVLLSLDDVRSWDAALDGKRFLLAVDRKSGEPNRLIVVQNLFQELRAKLP